MTDRKFAMRLAVVCWMVGLMGCLVAAPEGPAVAAAAAGEMTVAFWNCENMFDAFDDPQLDAEDILTSAQVREKLEKDAKVLLALNADIVGLMEVENHVLLRELVSRHLAQAGYGYFMLLEGRDTRGIDVAIVSKKPFLARSFALPNFPRGVLAARFVEQGQPFYVLVNHWKSRREGQSDSEESRIKSAETVVQIVKQELTRYEGQAVPVIVGGDLNDTDDDRSLQILTQGGLINTLAPLAAADRWTIGNYDPDADDMRLEGFDHLLISSELAKGGKMQWKSTSVFRPSFMVNERIIKGKRFALPMDDYKDRIGYSDHWPVVGRFVVP